VLPVVQMLEYEMATNADKLKSIVDQGKEMAAAGHFDSAAILQAVQDFDRRLYLAVWNLFCLYVIFSCCCYDSVKPLQFFCQFMLLSFSALTLLVGRQEGHPACKIFCQSMLLSYLIEERQLMFLVSYKVVIILYCELQCVCPW